MRGGLRTGVALPAVVAASMSLLSCGRQESSQKPPRNVLIFVFDAARADHFGCYGYDRDTTPNVDRFARRAFRFEKAFSEASFTFGSLAALMTGAYPPRSGLLDPQRISEEHQTLAEMAHDHGMRTMAYSENPFFTSELRMDQGFDEFVEAFPYEAFEASATRFPTFESETGIRRVLDWIDEGGGVPFFALVQVLRPHNPYAAPPPFAGRFGSSENERDLGLTETLLAIDKGDRTVDEEEMSEIVKLYDENLAYADSLFGRLLEGLERRKLMENTVVVVLSDHGEAFQEHGHMLHTSTVYDEMTHVPLLIHWPGRETGVVSTFQVQLTDVTRTLFDHLLGTGGSDYLQGVSLMPFLRGKTTEKQRVVYSWTMEHYGSVAARAPDYKLVIQRSPQHETTRLELYDLSSDPGETRPIVDSPSANRLALSRALEDFLRSCPHPDAPDSSGDESISEETRKRLRSLGYLR
jgi:arylsulfatase A-like enzyme